MSVNASFSTSSSHWKKSITQCLVPPKWAPVDSPTGIKLGPQSHPQSTFSTMANAWWASAVARITLSPARWIVAWLNLLAFNSSMIATIAVCSWLAAHGQILIFFPLTLCRRSFISVCSQNDFELENLGGIGYLGFLLSRQIIWMLLFDTLTCRWKL